MSKMAAEGSGECFAMIRAQHRSPLKTLFACFEFTAQMAATPEMLANNLAFLQLDLTDPEFRQWTLLNARSTAEGYESLIREAIRARELKRCDAPALSRLISATLHGSMVSWAFFQEGKAADWVRRDMKRCSNRTAAPSRSGRQTRRRPQRTKCRVWRLSGLATRPTGLKSEP